MASMWATPPQINTPKRKPNHLKPNLFFMGNSFRQRLLALCCAAYKTSQTEKAPCLSAQSNARSAKARCLSRRRAGYWGGGRQQSACLLYRFVQRGLLLGLCETPCVFELPSQQKAARALGLPSQQKASTRIALQPKGKQSEHTALQPTQKASKANASPHKVKAERPVSACPDAGKNVYQRIALGISAFIARLGSDGLDVKNHITGLLFSTKTVFRNAAQERSPRSAED